MRQAPPTVLAGSGTAPQYKVEYVATLDQGLEKAVDETTQRDSREGWRLLTVSAYSAQDHNLRTARYPACILVFQK